MGGRPIFSAVPRSNGDSQAAHVLDWGQQAEARKPRSLC